LLVFHPLSQNSVYAREMSFALGLQPVEDVGVDPYRTLLFDGPKELAA
jgi:hypothetical protein